MIISVPYRGYLNSNLERIREELLDVGIKISVPYRGYLNSNWHEEEPAPWQEEFPSPTGAISILIDELEDYVEQVKFPSPTGAISILIPPPHIPLSASLPGSICVGNIFSGKILYLFFSNLPARLYFQGAR